MLSLFESNKSISNLLNQPDQYQIPLILIQLILILLMLILVINDHSDELNSSDFDLFDSESDSSGYVDS